jgi:predicted nucleic acid-binding protein
LKVIFDSDILIDHFRDPDLYDTLATAIDRSQVYVSSIVAMELRAACRRPAEIRVLEQFLRPFEVARRIIPPDHQACLHAGAILSLLGTKYGLDPHKRRSLSNDVLIAASALRIGAALITRNHSDFSLISRCIPLVWFGSVEEFLAAP